MKLIPPLCTLLTLATLIGSAGASGAAGRHAGRAANEFAVPPLEVRVLGQRSWLRGGPAGLRVVVTNHDTGRAVPATVTLSLQHAPAKPGGEAAQVSRLYQGPTTNLGTLDAAFRAPAVEPGSYVCAIEVTSRLGNELLKEPVQITESAQTLLTCDKPLYQPGQVIHLRALTLDMATRAPLGDRPITFEIEDARGNKVFKKKQTLSRFGLASVDFQLADEVNMGEFTLRAVLPEGPTEKKVRVERYVLPKYRIVVSTLKPYYLPGETVSGTVKANYFFGKPVSSGDVTVTVNTIDIGVTKLGELKGQTGATGEYAFQYRLPGAFVGQPFEQGKAVVELAVAVKDTADHRQEQRLSVPVVKEAVQVVIVPERPALIPGVSNRAFIAAATADGAPLKKARIEVTVTEAGAPQAVLRVLTTDDLGLTVCDYTPKASSVTINAGVTGEGQHGASTRVVSSAPGLNGLILRTDKTLARVGDRLSLEALTTQRTGTLYLDVIRNRQTILTRAEPIRAGGARFVLPVTPDMAGTLELHAYQIQPDEQIVRDTRTIVVSPANDIDVKVTADHAEYRPGGDALLHFTVLDGQKRPVAAAIGLAIVDESVFALSELQPGLERIYFTLEKELMEPKYEIHGLRPTGLLQPRPSDLLLRGGAPAAERAAYEQGRQRAAAMILAAAPPASEFTLSANTYQTRWLQMQAKLASRMQQLHGSLAAAAQKFRTDTGAPLTEAESLERLAAKGYITYAELLDPWGHPYRAELFGRHDYQRYFALLSAGPDGKFGTADDVRENGNRSRGRRGFGDQNWAVDFADRPMLQEDLAGGFAGGAGGAQALAFARAPMAADKLMIEKAANGATQLRATVAAAAGPAAPRVREYFPETMLWNPALLTDEKGHAELRVPMADSITTWRVSMMANSLAGQLGSADAPIKVFQDFFADIDLPISLTQGDHVSVPVTVYNYLPKAQDVKLTLAQEPWFALEGSATQTVHVDSGQVKVVYYPMSVKALGRHTLQVTAQGATLADAVRRQIDVTPNGKQVDVTANDRLEGKASKTITLPAEAIAGATGLWLKLYPGSFSQVVEGLDGILRMPNGCFEQTSSTTYPNVLVLDYLKRTKRINPEIQMKAEQYINVGYQRLVTFECKSGGFSWFGSEPAHQVLTAYGLLEFSDMAKVHEVDPALIQRTQAWLAARQRPDATWEESSQGIAEGIINRQTGALRTTAYIAWALAESGYAGPELARAVGYVEEHRAEAQDPYTLAAILNLLTKVKRDADVTAKTAAALIALAKSDAKAAWWQSDTKTFTGATDAGADLETTGLAAYGLVKWGRNSGFTNKVLIYLTQSKDSYGTWQTTQGTVWAMKSLLYATTNGGAGKGTITVMANGQKAATLPITADDNDVMRQVNLAEFVRPGANEVSLAFDGDGSMNYQLAARCFVPWQPAEGPAAQQGPLTLKVDYDKTLLAQDDTATVTVTIHNNTDKIAEMPLIDVGVPPGFTVNPEQLENAVAKKTISKYTVAARQVILYLEKLGPGETATVTYQVRAKFPIKARTPLSKAYPYYNPERVTLSAPQELTVTR